VLARNRAAGGVDFHHGGRLNYYEHHIGDFAEATAHLSFVEDAAYSRLIRKYYAQEKPLPADIKAVQRLVGARSKEEREAVESVLNEFFELPLDGWHQARCDAEIARYQDKQAKAKRSAQARWNAKPPQSEGNANASPDAMRTHSEGNAHQTPDTRHQSPDPNTHTESSSTADVRVSGDPPTDTPQEPTRAGHLCRLMRQAGIADTNPGHPDLIALANAGVTDAEVIGAARTAIERGKGYAYAVGTLKRQRIEAAQTAQQLHRGAMPQSRKDVQLQTAALMTGAPIAPQQNTPETIDVPARFITP
jgi:uncharacterized protein YdaU (DUF1376 family)